LTLFPTLLPPTRLPLLCHLSLYFNTLQTLDFWSQSCPVLHTLPCLETLTITFSFPDIRSHSTWKNESILSPLVGLSVKGEFVVNVDWLETERDREVAEYVPFLVVRRQVLEVDKERTRERTLVPRNDSEIWVMREDGPSDPDGV
jgi:hypothetical protein